jgi:hypothetical protein
MMRLAHNVGDIHHSNYNTREQILNCNDEIGFDGIYRNVYDNRDVLHNKSIYLFVMGFYIGKDNEFDLPYVPKLEPYCNVEELLSLVKNYGAKLGWHTWSHPDLTKLSREEIVKEITPPKFIRPTYFAYPHGLYNDLVIDCVKEVGYKWAWSVTQGTTNPNERDYNFKMYRDYIR